MMLGCPNRLCRAPVQRDDQFCERCGRQLRSNAGRRCPPVQCPGCADAGGTLDADGVCPRCGLQLGLEQGDHVEAVLDDVAGVTDRGRGRAVNEDAMALTAPGGDARVLVVCDGVSSCDEPAGAARAAAGACLGTLVSAVRAGRRYAEGAMAEALVRAHEATSAIPRPAVSDRCPPSSTIVAALLCGGSATIGWVGDSRAYLLGAAEARQLTEDHSWGVERTRRGLMAGEQVRGDPRARALTSWLGGTDARCAFAPSVSTIELPPGGRLVLCSDGLWSTAPRTADLARLMARLPAEASPLTVARSLTEHALARDGRDNVTVVVAAARGQEEEVVEP